MLIVLVVIVSLPAVTYFLLQVPSVQTVLTRKIAAKLSDNLNARIEIRRVDFIFFNKLSLSGIRIEDQSGNPAIISENVTASIRGVNPGNRTVRLNQLILQNSLINLEKINDSTLNIQFLIDALSPVDTTNRWEISLNALHIKTSAFSYKDNMQLPAENGIDFSNLNLSNLNLLIDNIDLDPENINFNVRYINFEEKSSFMLNHLSGLIAINQTGISADNLLIITPYSRIDLEQLDFGYNTFSDFSDFINNIEINGTFRESGLSLHDLSFFVPSLEEIDLNVTLAGSLSGKVNNFKGTALNISILNETTLLTGFNMIGLPDIRETFILLDITELKSATDDIHSLLSLFTKDEESYNLPGFLDQAGKLKYSGKFTGYIDDFFTDGELVTDIGTVKTDLALKPGNDFILDFKGNLQAINLNTGIISGSDQLGKATFNIEASGSLVSESEINATLSGIIDSIELFDYNYKNIELSGDIRSREFVGMAYINDPNLILQFTGRVDLSNEVPEFDFMANLSDVRPYHLNLIEDNPDLAFSFTSIANFQGNSFDNLNGEISLLDTYFSNNQTQFSLDNAKLTASGENHNRKLEFTSSLAEASLEGDYEFETIANSFNKLFYKYLPSYKESNSELLSSTRNNFEFNVEIKDLSKFTDFFFPELSISEGTTFTGNYNPSEYYSLLSVSSDYFRIGNNSFDNIIFSSESNDSLFKFDAWVETASFSDQFNFENLNLKSKILNDSISVLTNWNNIGESLYRGNISADALFQRKQGSVLPVIDIKINPSEVVIADSLWLISGSYITIDSSSYNFQEFQFSHKSHNFKLDGTLSDNPDDSLNIEFNSIDLKYLDILTSIDNFKLRGIISGGASVSNTRGSPVFDANFEIEELQINDQNFGDLKTSSHWNNIANLIEIRTVSTRDDQNIIDIAGNYNPSSDSIDFQIKINEISLQTFDGYIDEVFGNLRGDAGGDLVVTGTLKRPMINGTMSLNDAAFTIGYLGTRYRFTRDIQINDNEISFSQLPVYDQNNNVCIANGTVSSNFFRDFNLNIFLYPNRFMALNTTPRDNELFYGRVITSGLIHINGPVQNLNMNISARTERNTQFFIPLQKSSQAGDLNFLTFTSGDSDENGGINGQTNNLLQQDIEPRGIQLSFDLDITPDAEVQIIFDSKIGDIIRGRGTGSLKMEINSSGQFTMFGEYIIEQGDYLFTLQNVINKRFEIERGGSLSWSGSPFDANIDLQAVYRLRAPLNTLMAPYTNGTDERYTRRIPVECQIIMQDKLVSPSISFDINLPTADPDTRRNLEGILNTEEKINRQFLALLVINNFLPEQDLAGPGMGNTFGTSATEAGINTVSEFLSNQLSNWLSQLSRDIDFGINWRPGDEITPDEVELALSTQVLNDRVSINGHVDVGGRQTNTSNIVGDFDVDIKLNRSGKLRLKAFTRANDNLLRPYLAPYTQGVGLFYREEFDTLCELVNRYWSALFKTGKEEEEEEEDEDGNGTNSNDNLSIY